MSPSDRFEQPLIKTRENPRIQGTDIAKVLWLIFGVALGARLAYAVAIYFAMGPSGLTLEDSSLYLILADNFAQYGDFVRAPGPDALSPETERMPLYIIWLALHRAISGLSEPLFPALSQAAIGALGCTLVARLGWAVDQRLLLPVGLFAALNPTQIITDTLILTDALFYFFTTLALFATVRWFREPTWRWASVLGLALGLAVSTRAMMLPWVAALIMLLPLFSLWLRRFRPTVLAHVAIAILICATLQAPILVRNISLYDTVLLTSQGGGHTLNWIAPLVLEAADGTPHAEGAKIMNARFAESQDGPMPDNPFARSRLMSEFAFAQVTDMGLAAVAKAWLIGGAINLLAPAGTLSPLVRSLPRTGFYDTPGESKTEKVLRFLFNNDNPTYAWVLVLGSLAVIAIRVLQVAGVVQGLRRPGLSHRAVSADQKRLVRATIILLALWVTFFVVIHGPIASPKYRAPLEPVGAVYFSFAVIALSSWWSRRRAPG